MMFRFYSENDVRKLVSRLKEEYDAVLARRAQASARLKEENRVLRARVSVLESERGDVSSALVHAVSEGERIRREGRTEVENDRKQLLLLAEKCRLLSERLLKKYPDEDDCAEFAAFTQALRQNLGLEAEESEFDMEEVLAPKYPLDLEKLCRDMGVMEEES